MITGTTTYIPIDPEKSRGLNPYGKTFKDADANTSFRNNQNQYRNVQLAPNKELLNIPTVASKKIHIKS